MLHHTGSTRLAYLLHLWLAVLKAVTRPIKQSCTCRRKSLNAISIPRVSHLLGVILYIQAYPCFFRVKRRFNTTARASSDGWRRQWFAYLNKPDPQQRCWWAHEWTWAWKNSTWICRLKSGSKFSLWLFSLFRGRQHLLWLGLQERCFCRQGQSSVSQVTSLDWSATACCEHLRAYINAMAYWSRNEPWNNRYESVHLNTWTPWDDFFPTAILIFGNVYHIFYL